MRKKLFAVALALTMVVGTLAGCNSNDAGTSTDNNNTTTTEENTAAPEIEKIADGGGKVLNIYVWNTDFQKMIEKYYPDYDKKTGTIGDVKVNFIQNPNEGGVYQKKLDEALTAQESAAADDKIDIFLCEMDYVNKYTNTTLAAPILGLDIAESDLAQMYNYTKVAATDDSGVLRGISWQGCPAGFIYRRSYAKDIFGTDDPEQIQEQLKDWDSFTAAAEKVKEASDGKITMLSGYADAIRVYANNVSQKFVSDDNKLQLDPALEAWIDQTKDYTDKGYNQKTKIWDDDWQAGMGENGNVFGYFGPAWLINFTMAPNSGSKTDKDGNYTGGGSYGDWAICTGPQSFNWGGSFICAATGTDNATLVADIMKKFCTDKDIMCKISEGTQDFINNKEANAQLEKDGVTSGLLGGQSLVAALGAAAENIDCSNISPYDQMCIENLYNAMYDYFDGKCSKDEAIAKWKDETHKSYPELK
ncbi:MAG: carbohydrate ABC transporter substrate-binding protein [Lachnospiraceae bacterium]|nr:carbohydrate ABC transporter substrate-binding protein [Lachnospiraceae bacterium]